MCVVWTYPIVCIIVHLYGLVAAVPLQPLVGGLGLLEVFETLYTIAVEERVVSCGLVKPLGVLL